MNFELPEAQEEIARQVRALCTKNARGSQELNSIAEHVLGLPRSH